MNKVYESEKVVSSGVYVLDSSEQNSSPVNLAWALNSLTDGDGFHYHLEKDASVEHIDWVKLYSHNPKVLIVSGIHGNEFETAEVFEENQGEFLVLRMQILRAHVAAVFMGSRGYDAPKSNDGGKHFDLNRQFTFSGKEKNWDDFFRKVTYPEARLLLEALRENSQAEFLFTFHEDPLRTNNFYFYDSPYDENEDNLFESVREIRIELHATLLAHGFKMLNGPDDAADPYLANIAKNGYIYQPLIHKDRTRKTDTSFESAAIELGGKGLTNMKRVFTFEIPGRMDREGKALLIKIIQRQFIVPFLAAQGITE